MSDRHAGIAKWLREQHPGITHYFDLWHLARNVVKKVTMGGKEKGCEILLEWVKAIRNHLYWCTTSTTPGFEDMIKGKWLSIMRHVANKHDDHPDLLFPKCRHDTLERRNWIKIGMDVFFVKRLYFMAGGPCKMFKELHKCEFQYSI